MSLKTIPLVLACLFGASCAADPVRQPDEPPEEEEGPPTQAKNDASVQPAAADAGSNQPVPSDTSSQDAAALASDTASVPTPPATKPALRLAVVLSFHGVAAETFWPIGTSTAVSYEGSLKPLLPYANRLMQVKGVDMDPSPTSLSQDDSNYVRLLLTGKTSISMKNDSYPHYESEAASLDVLFAKANNNESACFVPLRTWPSGPVTPFWSGAQKPLGCAQNIESWAQKLGVTTAPGHDVDDAAFDADDVQRSLKLGAEALARRKILAMGTTIRVSESKAASFGLLELHSSLHKYEDLDVRSKVVPAITQYNRFAAQRVADLAAAIAAQKAEDGSSLLDHTVIVWLSSMGPGHGLSDIPVVILGDAHGALRSSGFANVGRRSIKDLLATLAKALQLPQNSFPPPGVTASPIVELLKQ